MQRKGESNWRPVVYASRSLTETEQCHAQIEKEALAVTWSCEKISDYILGSKFKIETDHKPLVPLLSRKHLNDLPPRVLRFRLMARFDYTIAHVPGWLLYTADTLPGSCCKSRARFPAGGGGDIRELHNQDVPPSNRTEIRYLSPVTGAGPCYCPGATVLQERVAKETASVARAHSLLESQRQSHYM